MPREANKKVFDTVEKAQDFLRKVKKVRNIEGNIAVPSAEMLKLSLALEQIFDAATIAGIVVEGSIKFDMLPVLKRGRVAGSGRGNVFHALVKMILDSEDKGAGLPADILTLAFECKDRMDAAEKRAAEKEKAETTAPAEAPPAVV